MTAKEIDKPLVNGGVMELIGFSKGDSSVVAIAKSDMLKMSEIEVRDFIKGQVIPAIFDGLRYSASYLLEKIKTGDILPCLVNKAINKGMLADVPHREFLDLAIVYRVVVDNPKNFEGDSTVLLNNVVVNAAGVTEQELYERGMEFLAKNLRIRNLFQVVAEQMGIPCNFPDPCDMLVCDNDMAQGGASVMMLLPEILGDGYILPTSVYNVIFLREAGDVEELARMMEEVNIYQVAPEERLSNSVYQIRNGKVELAFEGSEL